MHSKYNYCPDALARAGEPGGTVHDKQNPSYHLKRKEGLHNSNRSSLA
jgi:hypothetical protein